MKGKKNLLNTKDAVEQKVTSGKETKENKPATNKVLRFLMLPLTLLCSSTKGFNKSSSLSLHIVCVLFLSCFFNGSSVNATARQGVDKLMRAYRNKSELCFNTS